MTPDGRLLVAAPQGVQKGIRELLKDAEKRPTPSGPSSIELTYWLVVARPDQAATVGPGLTELTAPLKAVSGAEGGLSFELLDRVSLVVLSDDQGSTSSKHFQVRQRASLSGNRVVANVELDPNGPAKLDTRVALDVDQFLVLGETGYEPQTGGAPTPKDDGSRLLYVVRPTLKNAPKP